MNNIAPRPVEPLTDENGNVTRVWYNFLTGGVGIVADVTTADATDLATAITLTNANKAKINEILQALRDGGILEV
jgi:hypothetical protein